MPRAEEYETYEVFTARGGGQPLRHAGSVRAPDPQVAAVFARTMYDEWRWREMFVVPRKAIVRVIRPA
jgi:1,2-phenylacetyl-CoA epoxidase PaaB subunit